MAFNNQTLVKFTVLGLAILTFGLWLATTATTTGVRPFTSPLVVRALGVGLVAASLTLIVPVMKMFTRRNDLAIESNGSRVVLRAVAGRVRDLAWIEILAVSSKPNGVFLELQTGERIRVYTQVVDIGTGSATDEVARFLEGEVRRHRA